MLNGLSLFSGIGGLDLALKDWVRPIAYCENDRYAQSVLLSRMFDGELHNAPIWDDVRTLRANDITPIDIVYGGFPCQDISVAGTGKGLEGSRSSLFYEIIRIVSDCRPSFVFLENVPAITVRGLEKVTLELTKLRYDCRWTIVSAGELGAVHLRKRFWLLGHTNGEHRDLQKSKIPDTDELLLRKEQVRLQRECDTSQSSWVGKSRPSTGTPKWFLEPRVGRAGNGIQSRMDRNKGLGNAVVPIQAKEAFMRLMGLIGDEE